MRHFDNSRHDCFSGEKFNGEDRTAHGPLRLALFAITLCWQAPVPVEAQGNCQWRPVERAGINSHQPGPPWCANGEFLAGMDLDSQRRYAPHDSPVVGQVCCRRAANGWDGRPFWRPVQRAGINSHQPGRPWCPEGAYLVSVDLDGDRRYAPHDSPVVGQAQCAYPANRPRGGSRCSWEGVSAAGKNSHQPEQWCPAGTYLVAYDLDGPRNFAEHDSPIVRQALCCR